MESGEKLSDDFRRAAADLIERFRRERQERTGNLEEADKISEQELLREAMNTVGKEGRLGQNIRCVVSVSMLTEGWDASTVTHVLGVPGLRNAAPVRAGGGAGAPAPVL